jgi:uncharacterized protein
MKAHSAYWSGLMGKGMVLVFGPVLDSAGPYGLAVLRLADDADPQALCSDDPVIRAGGGFVFEVSPMATAIVPQ